MPYLAVAKLLAFIKLKLRKQTHSHFRTLCRNCMLRLTFALLLAAVALAAKGPVYVVLWFDTEDYIATGSTRHIFCNRQMEPVRLPAKYRPMFGIEK